VNKFGLNYEFHKSKNPQAKTMVFLHGLTGNTKRWTTYVNDLKNDNNLILIDLIGHGQSDFPDDLKDFSPQSQAEKIENLIKDLNTKNITLVSHSYSYTIALEILQRKKIRIARFIMISPFFTEKKEETFKKTVLKILIKTWPILKHKRKSKEFAYPQKNKHPSFHDHKESIENIGIKSYLAHLHFCLNPKLDREITFKIPSLLIYKENDKLFSQQIHSKIKKFFINLKEYKILGQGHLFLIENKDEIIKAIKSF